MPREGTLLRSSKHPLKDTGKKQPHKQLPGSSHLSQETLSPKQGRKSIKTTCQKPGRGENPQPGRAQTAVPPPLWTGVLGGREVTLISFHPSVSEIQAVLLITRSDLLLWGSQEAPGPTGTTLRAHARGSPPCLPAHPSPSMAGELEAGSACATAVRSSWEKIQSTLTPKALLTTFLDFEPRPRIPSHRVSTPGPESIQFADQKTRNTLCMGQ